MKCSMSYRLGLAILVLATMQVCLSTAQNNMVVCYYSSWATFRPGNGQFNPEDLDAHLCTHAIYTFIGINVDGTVRIMDPYNDLEENFGKGGFKRFNALRNINPKLKTLIAIGGWNEGSTTFSTVMKNPGLRALFIDNTYAFVKKYGFNGIDLDWEYPAQRGGIPEDRKNFVTLCREMKAKFSPEGLLVTTAVKAEVQSIPLSYDVAELVKYLDFINLMTYDYHGSWDTNTGSNSPLYPSSIDTDLTLNADATVRAWLESGAPPSKLTLGIPMYGHSFTLLNAKSPGLGAVASGPGIPGHFTQEAGSLGYNEICEMLKPGGWSENWAAQQKVPFAFQNTLWVGYDNIDSVRIKTEYAMQKGLGGMMVWGVEMDDFRGLCGDGKFPLMNKIKSTLNGGFRARPPYHE